MHQRFRQTPLQACRTNRKEQQLENKLRHLYTLQQIDNQLDELEELKGDLPRIVRDLEEKQSNLQNRVGELETTMRSSFSGRDNADSEIISLKEKMTKYKTQQFEVKTNREYDALTREIDYAANMVVKLEKDMEFLETRATIARNDIESAKKELEELEVELKEKRAELAEVSKTTEDEERKYQHDREKIVVRISKEDLAVYDRIRKAKKGKAVVPVRRGACGGCFNKVPPQKLLELRQHKYVYTCERCGRILVSDDIAQASSSAA